MSNHRLYGAGLRGKELHDTSVRMYQDSFKHLRTDYFDHYLFHILGSGAGMEEMRGRLYDCGIASIILREREAEHRGEHAPPERRRCGLLENHAVRLLSVTTAVCSSCARLLPA